MTIVVFSFVSRSRSRTSVMYAHMCIHHDCLIVWRLCRFACPYIIIISRHLARINPLQKHNNNNSDKYPKKYLYLLAAKYVAVAVAVAIATVVSVSVSVSEGVSVCVCVYMVYMQLCLSYRTCCIATNVWFRLQFGFQFLGCFCWHFVPLAFTCAQLRPLLSWLGRSTQPPLLHPQPLAYYCCFIINPFYKHKTLLRISTVLGRIS